jgi:UDP-2,3-diacylglucosamine hydrolase
VPIRHAVIFSDVHLDARWPARTERFLEFVRWLGERRPERVFCLGDLFHVWIGPRELERPDARPVLEALAGLTRAGVRLTLFHGNRDFHLGREIVERVGADAVVPDGLTVSLAVPGPEAPRRLYLAHGDLLCARDFAYRAMRRVIRSGPFRGLYLSLPLPLALGIAGGMASASRKVVARKSTRTLSLAATAVRRIFARGADVAAVGHIHRAGRIALEVEGRRRLLFTLGAWDGDAASYVEVRDGRFALRDGPGGSALLEENL